MPHNEGENAGIRIRILASVASFIFNEARGLLAAGTGQDEFGVDVSGVAPELDTIPSDTDGYRWANAVARFLNHLIHTLRPALQEFYDERRNSIIEETISMALGDQENIDPSLFEGEGEI